MNIPLHKTNRISYEEVNTVYAEIVAEGEAATLQQIRARLGDRGSLQTIKKLRDQIVKASDEEERKKNPEIPTDEVRLMFLGQAEHLLILAHSEGLRRGHEKSREIQLKLNTLEQERDQLLSDFEDCQRTVSEKTDEIGCIKEAGENALAMERQRVDTARLEVDAVRTQLTSYQARTGAKIEMLEDALRVATKDLTDTKLSLANARGKIALLTKSGPRSMSVGS